MVRLGPQLEGRVVVRGVIESKTRKAEEREDTQIIVFIQVDLGVFRANGVGLIM